MKRSTRLVASVGRLLTCLRPVPVRTGILGAGAALGLAGLAPAPVHAGSIVHLTPEQVLAQSDAIFQGTVVAAHFGWTDQRQVFATTEYTVRIDRVLLDRAGVLAGRTTDGQTTLSIMGGVQAGVKYLVSGMPQFAIGESGFFMLSAQNLRNNAMSPLVGDGEGYFPIRAHNGEWTVHTPGGCAGPSRPVDFRFFAKVRDPNAWYTPEAFAAEIARALPIADANPELRAAAGAPVPAHLAGRAFGASEHPTLTVGDGAPVLLAPAAVPMSMSTVTKPLPPLRRFVEAQTQADPVREALEYGFPDDTLPQIGPIPFNVPPGTWWRQAFFDEQNRWNRYQPGLFTVFTNSNNEIGWPNGRNETGFLTNQQMIDLYGRGWGANTLARCITREGAFTDHIVESDIAYNVTQTFSDDQQVIYGNAAISSFRSTALHELGHAFGRVHAWESNPGSSLPSCMNYFNSGFYDAESDRVFADDAESVRAAYANASITDFGILLWRMSGTLVPFGNPPTNVNGVVGLNMPPSVLQGNAFAIYDTRLENIGTQTRATTIDWWLDPTPYDFDFSGAIYCSSTNIGTLDRASGVAVYTFVQTPSATPPGQYYLCAVIADDDAVLDNDFAWSQNRIRVDYNPAFAPPSNDSRNTPQSIGIGTYTGSTQFATPDGTTTCGSSNSTPDVWFTMIAPYAGTLEADTCVSGFDTVLSVQRRQFNPITGAFTYTQLDCNDDAAIGNCGGTTRSRVTASVNANDLLRFRLSGFNGAKGSYVLNTRVFPANDFCADAVPITTGSYTATLAGATNDRTGSCGQTQSTADVWFRYTWPQGCNTVTFDTYGSDFDTVLEVLPVCSAFNIPAIECNDDCTQVGPSCVTVVRGAETTLRVRVSRYGGSPPAGSFITLNASTPAPSNDACVAAPALPDGDYAFDSSCGSADPLPLPLACGSTACEADFWFTYTAPITGYLTASAAASFPFAVTIYPGAACPGDPEQAIACSVGEAGAGAGMSIGAGETVLLRFGGVTMAGFPTPIGAGTFSIHTTELPPANDACESAEGVLVGQSVSGNLTLATADGSSSADRSAGGPDVWYAFVAPADGTLVVSTCGTLLAGGLDTVVSIHAACPGDTLSELIASDVLSAFGCPAEDPMLIDVQDAQVEAPVVAGTPYLIRIGATDPANLGTGAFTARIDFVAPSDSCASPGALAEGDTLVSTAGATPDGPAHECLDGTEPDVWFTLVTSCTGTARISACAQPIAVKLAVYDVPCPAAENLPLACNAGDGPECPGGSASLDFPCIAGGTYYVRLAGDAPAASVLSVGCFPAAHAADTCGNGSTVLDGENPVITLGATPGGEADACFDGSENDVWYTYTATCTGSVTIALCGDEADSKVAVYAGTDCPPGEPIACNDNDGVLCAGLGASVQFAGEAGLVYQVRLAIADDAEHTLSITCTPATGNPLDFNGDGFVEPGDLDEFITAFFSDNEEERSRCDYNSDGFVEPGDLDEFITAYFTQ